MILLRGSSVQLCEIWLHSPFVCERCPFADAAPARRLRREPSHEMLVGSTDKGNAMTCRFGTIPQALAVIALVLFGSAITSSAQVFTGRIDVTAEDSTGGRLPGVNVELTGPVNHTQVTDTQGQA